MEKKTIFEDENESGFVPIALIDSSSSTNVGYMGAVSVFKRQMAALKQLPYNSFRLLFWNAPGSNEKFPNGVLIWSYAVERDKLDQPFAYVEKFIQRNCGTDPCPAFRSIPHEWISTSGITRLIYVTDGQLGNGRMNGYELQKIQGNVAAAIKVALGLGRMILHVITVETTNRDFKQLETQNVAAGGDFYGAIENHGLTTSVSKFVSYTPNNDDGFVHMERAVQKPGFIPYGSRYFAELNILQFLDFIRSEVSAAKDDQDILLRIIQNLGATIVALNKDKPLYIKNEHLRTFGRLFDGTVLDTAFIKFVLEDVVRTENAGSAPVYAAYRKNRDIYYAEATGLLLKNVRDSIGVEQMFVTWPLSSSTDVKKIVSGHYRLIDRDIMYKNFRDEALLKYPTSALDVNGIRLPILPMLAGPLSPMQEQCLRQWIRVICSKIHGVIVVDDAIIYLALGTVLLVVISSIDETTKNVFRKIGLVMLNKKRLNSQTTEFERLVAGDAPIPNDGRIETFWRYMDLVNNTFGFKLRRMTLWYSMCLALRDVNLAARQRVHCEADLAKDNFTGLDTQNSKIEHYKIPVESAYDFVCPITLADLNSTGGFRILPHGPNKCEPMTIISKEGLEQLFSKPRYAICPVCYYQLIRADLTEVGPKPLLATELKVFNALDSNPFMTSFSTTSHTAPTVQKKRVGVLVVMKGTVGSGKSTFTDAIERTTKERGGICIVAGTDRYCKNGANPRSAIDMVKRDLRRLDSSEITEATGPLVVVVDTCGERNENNSAFDYNFNGWRRIEVWPNLTPAARRDAVGSGYMAWTLRNVLLRGRPAQNDNFWLNSEGAGISVCIDVNHKKAQTLGLKPGKKLAMANKEVLLDQLAEKADGYQRRLDQDLLLTTQIESLLKDIFS